MFGNVSVRPNGITSQKLAVLGMQRNFLRPESPDVATTRVTSYFPDCGTVYMCGWRQWPHHSTHSCEEEPVTDCTMGGGSKFDSGVVGRCGGTLGAFTSTYSTSGALAMGLKLLGCKS